MLDQLVESKNNSAENMAKGKLALAIGVIVVSVIVFFWGRDLFAKDFGLGGGDLELSTLVAPPPPDEEPPPKEEKQPEQKKQPDVDIRKELIQPITASPKVPDKIDTTTTKVNAMRENVKTMRGDVDATNPGAVTERGAGAVEGHTNTFGDTGQTAARTDDIDEPPPTPKPATPKPAPKTVSGGVLNGKAISLPKPPYPAAARAVRASGTVTVQVLISETGSVISASAAGGHPLLVPAAVAAARGARFSPTILSGQPVKVSGVITYNFVP